MTKPHCVAVVEAVVEAPVSQWPGLERSRSSCDVSSTLCKTALPACSSNAHSFCLIGNALCAHRQPCTSIHQTCSWLHSRDTGIANDGHARRSNISPDTKPWYKWQWGCQAAKWQRQAVSSFSQNGYEKMYIMHRWWNFRLGSFAWELSFGIMRLGTFAWDRSLGTFVWDSLRSHFYVTVLRCHFDLTSLSLRSHFDFTSTSLRLYVQGPAGGGVGWSSP